MKFLDNIIEELIDVSLWFYEAYQTVKDWIWPFNLLRHPLFSLTGAFFWLAHFFSDFNDWVDDVADQIEDILSWSNIRKLIRSWLPDLEDVVDWWDRWWKWVRQEIDDWWYSTKQTVQGWIDIATEGLDELRADWDDFWDTTWPQWTGKLDTLKAAWDTFRKVTLPTLISTIDLGAWWDSKWKEIDELIDSWFKSYEPFWAGWQDIYLEFRDFFEDPEKWLMDWFEKMLVRFW